MTVPSILLIASLISAVGLVIYFKKHISLTPIQWVIILLLTAVAVIASLMVGYTRIAGTVESTTYGWPHFFLHHATREIIENRPMNQWALSTRGTLYIFSDYLFYLSIIFFSVVGVKALKK